MCPSPSAGECEESVDSRQQKPGRRVAERQDPIPALSG